MKQFVIIGIAAFLFVMGFPVALSAPLDFVLAPSATARPFGFAVIGDVNGDGLEEPFAATATSESGAMVGIAVTESGLQDLSVSFGDFGWRSNDLRLGDINRDGCLDFVAQGYSATGRDTRALLYINDGTGRFFVDSDFYAKNLRGRGEGIVMADFNNDEFVDMFLPYYTVGCTSSATYECPNAPQHYLFLNDGSGKFTEVAALSGVALSAAPGGQPEGVQAADVNSDGKLDLYSSGHLFINVGNDAQGRPLFQECNCGLPTPSASGVGAGSRIDEGAKFLDWNNDGKLDLVLHCWTSGSTPNQNACPNFDNPLDRGIQLYENVGTPVSPSFQRRRFFVGSATRPVFSSSTTPYQTLRFQDSFGVNIYDLDNDGLEDVITAGGGQIPVNCTPACTPHQIYVFRNLGSGFERSNAGALSTLFTAGAAVAFMDANRDGKIDVVLPTASGYLYLNQSTTPSTGGTIRVTVLGRNGEANQYGRVVRVSPQSQPTLTMTRVVDGGSGLHSQNSYEVLVGTANSGSHLGTIVFPSVTPSGAPITVSFSATPSQFVSVLAPSIQNPSGQVIVSNQRPVASTQFCSSPVKHAIEALN